MTTAQQLRAARALLGMSQDELAQLMNRTTKTIRRAETDKDTVAEITINEMRLALEKAGIEFIEENGGGPGVRLRK